MAPAKEIREFSDVIRRAMGVPRVVGAGIGRRSRCGSYRDSGEPVLTVLVDKSGPGDDIKIAGALGQGFREQVEVMEVGCVSALRLERKS